MQLSINKREKNHTKKLRRFNNVPAVIYAKGVKNENIYLSQADFKKHLAKLNPGELSTCIFTLKSEKETFKAIVKEIQYFVTTYDISHIDFMRLDDKTKITAKVPIRFIGVAGCVGIKQGGNLRQIIRAVKVKCFSKDLPKEFVFDIEKMELGQTKRVSDIVLPKGVELVTKKLREVVVAITKR